MQNKTAEYMLDDLTVVFGIEEQMKDFYAENSDLSRPNPSTDREKQAATDRMDAIKSAEKGLLSALLFSLSAPYIREIGKALNLHDFLLAENRHIFVALISLCNKGGTLTPDIVVEQCSGIYKDQPELLKKKINDWLDSWDEQPWQRFLAEMRELRCQHTDDDEKPLIKFNEYEASQLAMLRLPPVKCVGSQWYVFQSGTWQKKDRQIFNLTIQESIYELHRTAPKVKEVFDLIEGANQVEEGCLKGFYEFAENGAILLNAANGIIRVDAKSQPPVSLLPHDAQRNFTLSLAAAYDPSATCPIFERVISEQLFHEEDRQVFRLCLGNFFLPNASREVCLVIYGPGGTGKSTLADGVVAVFGVDLVQRISLTDLATPRDTAFTTSSTPLSM